MKKLIAIIGTLMIVVMFFRAINGAEAMPISNILVYLSENIPEPLDPSVFDYINNVKDRFSDFEWSEDLDFFENLKNVLKTFFNIFAQLFLVINTLFYVFIHNILMAAVAILKIIWYLLGFGG